MLRITYFYRLFKKQSKKTQNLSADGGMAFDTIIVTEKIYILTASNWVYSINNRNLRPKLC